MAEGTKDINIVITGKEVLEGGCVGVTVTLMGSTMAELATNELPHLLHGLGLTDYAKDTGVSSGFDYIFDFIFD